MLRPRHLEFIGARRNGTILIEDKDDPNPSLVVLIDWDDTGIVVLDGDEKRHFAYDDLKSIIRWS